MVRCGNATMTPAPPVTRKPPTTPTLQPNTTIETKEVKEREPTTLPPSTDIDEDKPSITEDKGSPTDENGNNIFTGDEQAIGKNNFGLSDNPLSQENPNEPDAHGGNGGIQRPTVPPNLPFANIETPDDTVTPFDNKILNEDSAENQNDPDKPELNHRLDSMKERENKNKDFVPITPLPSSETGITDAPSYPFPSKNGKDDSDNTLNNDMDRDWDDNVVHVSLDKTPLPKEYYPVNDIMEQTAEKSTTTSQATPELAIKTSLDNRDNTAKGNDTDQIGSVHNPSMDVIPSNEFEDKQYENNGIVSKPDPEHKNNQDDTDSRTRNNSTTAVDIVTPTELNDRTNIPRNGHEDEHNKPSEYRPIYPSVHTVDDEIIYPYPVDQETSTHFSIYDYEDYEDEYQHDTNLNSSDNAQVPIFTNDVSGESDTNKDVVLNPENGKDSHDMTKIDSVDEVKHKGNVNEYPADLNVPGLTGGNFTFNSTTSHNTTGSVDKTSFI